MSVYFQYRDAGSVQPLLDKLAIPSGIFDSAGTTTIDWENGMLLYRGDIGFRGSRDAGLRSATDDASIRRMLRIHGVRLADHVGKRRHRAMLIREYAVPVFHLDALALFRGRASMTTAGQGGKKAAAWKTEMLEEVEPDWSNRLHRSLAREAVRAVYGAGLDMALVTLGVLPEEQIVIYDVAAAPAMSGRLTELFATAINCFAEQEAAEGAGGDRIMLGMDPEFILHEPVGGKVVSASRFLHRTGKAGCDGIRLQDRRMIYPLAELRPEPSAELERLVVNLRKTMLYASRQITDTSLEWLAGGMPKRGFALGGHVHMSGIWLNSRLLRALDNYLALPLMQIEAESAARRRPRYGWLGDFRRQPHGGFEYRTLPSWIVSPRVTKGVLALAFLIARDYKRLNLRPLMEERAVISFYRGGKSELADTVRLLWHDLESTPTYKEYRAYLQPLKEQVVGMRPWEEQTDFRKHWKIYPYAATDRSVKS